MRKIYFIISILLSFNISLAQSIRKNYLEMTDNEKIDLVNALYQLRTGPDLINDLATFHANYFVFDNTDDPNGLAIHLNLPDRPENDIFFSWHRRQMIELEQAMQEINPNISIPYWDSSVDQSVNSTLWDQDFMGQFDNDWGLNRNLANSGPLPTPQLIIEVQSISDFLTYSNTIERGDIHTGGHRWAGGVMRTGRSPQDPIFYLHHANVDRLWAEWQEENQNSIFQRTSMVRYDGTYVFNGQALPLVNPNDIVDTRHFGTFYALNGLVSLDNYTVSNTYNNQENFYYQFTIQAGNNFLIPSGNDCKIESVNEILLYPGFEAIRGSSFIAIIDNEPVNKLPLSKRRNEIVRNQIPFEVLGELVNIYDNFDKIKSEIVMLEPFPNPFLEKITIQFNEKINMSEVIIYDLMGRVVKRKNIYNSNRVDVSNLTDLSSGVYIVRIIDKNNTIILNEKIIKI